MKEAVNLLFSTPVYTLNLQGDKFVQVQDEISKVIESTDIEHRVKHVDGWCDNVLTDFDYNPQSDGNYKNFIVDNNMSNFKDMVDVAVSNFANCVEYVLTKKLNILGSWINYYHKDGYQNSHSHSGFTISGCYYYSTSGEDGSIVFENPNPIFNCVSAFPLNTSINCLAYEIKPKAGMLLLFPSWLRHRVNVNRTESKRISIAFNLA